MVLNFRKGSAFAKKRAKKILKDLNPIDIKKITVIRHAAIGDFMVIRPFLIELKNYFPNAKITLSVDANAMYGMPKDLVDEIHIIHRNNPLNLTKKTNIFQRIKEIKKLPKQDIIFDLTDSTLTLIFIIFSKARLKIGYPYRWIRRIFFDIAVLRSDFVLEAENIMHMINILGSKKIFPFSFGYEKHYPKNIKKRIVYFAGASTKNKCWEREKFGSLIKKLSQKYKDYEHIILQGINEDEMFLDIYTPIKDIKNIKLQSSMKLNNTMQFLADSSLVISNDTGIRNMAIAVETPTIGIFFLTGPFRYWPRDRKHICIFNENYISPKVEDVYDTTIKLMEKIYDN